MSARPEALRDAGMQQAEEHADARVLAAVDAAIDQLNASGRPWSANDLRDIAPTAGPLIGARVRAAATRRPREMVRVGYVPSDLPSTHAHPIALWVGVQVAEDIERARRLGGAA